MRPSSRSKERLQRCTTQVWRIQRSGEEEERKEDNDDKEEEWKAWLPKRVAMRPKC